MKCLFLIVPIALLLISSESKRASRSLLEKYLNVTTTERGTVGLCEVELQFFQVILRCSKQNISEASILQRMQQEVPPDRNNIQVTLKCTRCQFTNNVINQETLGLGDRLLEIEINDSPIESLNLTHLNFVDNVSIKNAKLTSMPLESLPPILKKLRLTHNSFSVIEKEHFRKFYRLDTLSLRSNGITEVKEGAFDDKTDYLQSLDLSENKIKSLPAKLLANLPKLTDIDLSGNLLYSLDLDFFFGRDKLVSIDISNNPLFDITYKTVFIRQQLAHALQSININALPCSTLLLELWDHIERDYTIARSTDYEIALEGIQMYEIYTAVNFQLAKTAHRIPVAWYEREKNGIRCIDFYGSQWSKRQGLDKITKSFKISDLIANLWKGIKLVSRQSAFGCELQALKHFLTPLNETIVRMEKTIPNIEFEGVDLRTRNVAKSASV